MPGADLAALIIKQIAEVGGEAFDRDFRKEILADSSPSSALSTLIHAVPRGVRVAVLVDEYDAAIIDCIKAGKWDAAYMGVEALRSLFMTTKDAYCSRRIEYFLVTGVARIARASLFSGANNFVDLTHEPIMSRILGFSERDIRANFPAQLERLGRVLSGSDAADSVTVAMSALRQEFNG
jgi:hypothetical protein